MNDKIDEYHSSKVLGWPYIDKLVNQTEAPKDEMTFEAMVNMTKQWLADEHINFVTLYSDEPGQSAEIYGPRSAKAKAAVAKVDDFIGRLLEEAVDVEQTNLVVLTTPGYVDVSLKTVVDLTNYNKAEDYVQISNGTVLGVQPPKGSGKYSLFGA